MHPRIKIRNKFVELLLNNTDCGASVFKNRSRPFVDQDGWQSELPAIVVYTNDETSSKYGDSPPTYLRTARIVVEVHQSSADEDLDDFLDHVSEQVEILISRYDWHLEDIDFGLGETRMQLVENAKKINGALAVTFQMTYYSYLPDDGKSAALEDFKIAAQTYRVGTADSQQTVNLP